MSTHNICFYKENKKKKKKKKKERKKNNAYASFDNSFADFFKRTLSIGRYIFYKKKKKKINK